MPVRAAGAYGLGPAEGGDPVAWTRSVMRHILSPTFGVRFRACVVFYLAGRSHPAHRGVLLYLELFSTVLEHPRAPQKNSLYYLLFVAQTVSFVVRCVRHVPVTIT